MAWVQSAEGIWVGGWVTVLNEETRHMSNLHLKTVFTAIELMVIGKLEKEDGMLVVGFV